MIFFPLLLRSLITGIAAIVAIHYFDRIEGEWILWSALFLALMPNKVSSLWRNQYVLLSCGLLIAVNCFIANALASNIFVLATYLFTVALLTLFIALSRALFAYPAFIINSLGLVSAGFAVNLDLSIQRTIAILLGMFLVMIVNFLVYPQTLRNQLKWAIANYLILMNRYQTCLFDIYLKRNYQDNIASYEKNLSELRSKIIIQLAIIRVIMKKLSMGENFQPFEKLFETVTDLGNLRFRLIDYSILEICEQELTLIARDLRESFNAVLRQKPLVTRNEEILSNLFHSTLQVIMKDPLIFLIFISNIKNIFTELRLIRDVC